MQMGSHSSGWKQEKVVLYSSKQNPGSFTRLLACLLACRLCFAAHKSNEATTVKSPHQTINHGTTRQIQHRPLDLGGDPPPPRRARTPRPRLDRHQPPRRYQVSTSYLIYLSATVEIFGQQNSNVCFFFPGVHMCARYRYFRRRQGQSDCIQLLVRFWWYRFGASAGRWSAYPPRKCTSRAGIRSQDTKINEHKLLHWN